MEPPFTTLEKGARTMKSLTGMGGVGNARELAEMLRQMGRGRDTILAHITPEEAQMLMDAGGSGDTNPNTGLPEFQEEDFFGSEFDPYAGQAVTSRAGDPNLNFDQFGGFPSEPMVGPQPQTRDDLGAMVEQQQAADFYGAPQMTYGEMASPEAQREINAYFGAQEPQGPGLAQTLESKLGGISDIAAKYPRLAQAAGYSAQGLVGMLQASRARKQGREEAARLSALGAPLRAQGESLRQQALSGTLTPQQAAQQEAARARLRQTASGRGAVTGTQAGMIESQLGRQRSELAQINLNNALKQLNLANAYDEAAIKASMVADREADDLLAAIAGNIGSQLASASPVQRAPRAQRPATPEVTRRPELPRGE